MRAVIFPTRRPVGDGSGTRPRLKLRRKPVATFFLGKGRYGTPLGFGRDRRSWHVWWPLVMAWLLPSSSSWRSTIGLWPIDEARQGFIDQGASARIKRAITPLGYPEYPEYPAKTAKFRAAVARFRAGVTHPRAVVARYRAAVTRFTLSVTPISMPISSNPLASSFIRRR